VLANAIGLFRSRTFVNHCGQDESSKSNMPQQHDIQNSQVRARWIARFPSSDESTFINIWLVDQALYLRCCSLSKENDNRTDHFSILACNTTNME